MPARQTFIHSDVLDVLGVQACRRILFHIADGATTASELLSRVAMSRSSLTRHLRSLQDAGLIRATGSGKAVEYELVADQIERTASVVAWLCSDPRPSSGNCPDLGQKNCPH